MKAVSPPPDSLPLLTGDRLLLWKSSDPRPRPKAMAFPSR